jgi:glycosyltransferase involved in cell wall biosynthesis
VRLVITVNQDWFFLSHRLPIARAARDGGAEVVVLAGDSGKGDAIRAEGLGFLPLPISRKGLNPAEELHTLWFLKRTYDRLRPDLIHHVTIKPVIYGSLAARWAGEIPVVNAVSGLGYGFTSTDTRAAILRPVLRLLYRWALGHPKSRTIFQNPEDLSDLVRMGVVRQERTALIRGSGVDCSRFQAAPEPKGPPIVMLASRMLWDKGVEDFVKAARIVRARDEGIRFVLVGEPDAGNPSTIPVSQLRSWSNEGAVEWWGQRSDMPDVMSQSTIVVLPTIYGEGVPKVLLEAAASGRPIIATDVRGCREIVRPGVNGVLIAPHSSADLAKAIQLLLSSPELRAQFAAAGRRIASTEFGEEVVVARTLEVYRELVGAHWR